MNTVLYFFYRYRQGLALFFSVLLFDLVLVEAVISMIQPMLAPPIPPMQTQWQEKAKAGKQKTLQDYQNLIMETTLFPDQLSTDSEQSIDNEQLSQSGSSPAFERLRLKLLGTVTGPRWFSRAYIRALRSKDKAAKSGRAYKTGEKVEGAKIVWIGRDRVKLLYQGNKETLYLYPKKQKKEEQNNKNSSTESDRTIKKVMTRGEVQKKVFGNINNIMKKIAIMPHFKNGKMRGYLIKKIHPSNPLYALGARSGDIVKAVNGHKIDNIKKVMKLWERVKKESNIQVDIKRKSKILTYDFHLRD